MSKDRERKKRKSYNWDEIQPDPTYHQNQASPTHNIFTKVASDKKFVNLGQGFLDFHDGESQLTRPQASQKEPELMNPTFSKPKSNSFVNLGNSNFNKVKKLSLSAVDHQKTKGTKPRTKIDKSKSYVNLGQKQSMAKKDSNQEAVTKEVYRIKCNY